MRVEWGQLSDGYEGSVIIVDANGDEIMTSVGSIQLGQVTSFFLTIWKGY